MSGRIKSACHSERSEESRPVYAGTNQGEIPRSARNDRLSPDNGQASAGEQFAPSIQTEVAGIHFQNPVWTASGTFGYGKEFSSLIDLNELGAIVVKGISPEPMEGNPSPRIYESESGMLNAIGLQNVGAKRFLTEKLPFLRTLKARCIVNVFAYSTEDYVRCVETLNQGEGISAYELNISCPNTRCGGIVYGSDPKLTEEVVAACKKAARYPLLVKLSPNVTDITVFARAAESAGADALSLVNTLVGMAIDIETRMPRLWNVTGGLSGPSIKPVALRMVYQAARAVKIPIIGLGGISTTEDALEFFIAGARAVQVGTANFYDPGASVRIVQGLRNYCQRKRLHLSAIIGSLKIPERAPPIGAGN
jgi:dihydroorotate dehydrogenase (NAD+) catalytic subunit